MHESSLRRAVRRYSPFWVGRSLRAVYYWPSDVLDTVLRRRDLAMPGRGEAAFVGDGDFAGMGRRFLDHFVRLGHLESHHRVLDVGCGIGRMALPLTGFLGPDGEYWGFDPVPKGIEWCRQHITSRFPRFHFDVADVWSKSYNRRGKTLARDYVFPYADASFDFVFTTSVFTHVVPADLENYVANIARVLRPQGTCFASYFLLNDTSRSCDAARDFCYPVDSNGACMAVSRVEFEKAVAFDEQFIRDVYRRSGLTIEEPVRHGRWVGGAGGPAFQDIIIARSRAVNEPSSLG